MKKEDKNFNILIITFFLTVVIIYIYSRFQYEKCNEEGWFEILINHILGLFVTGLFCLIFPFIIFMGYYIIYSALKDEIKNVLDTILPISISDNQKGDNIIYQIISFVGISVWGYFVWRDIIYGCI